VKFEDLDERAYDALKELDESGAQAVIKQFRESNLQVIFHLCFFCSFMFFCFFSFIFLSVILFLLE